jgi:hypothetical protein
MIRELAHTVQTESGLVAGLLIRSNGRELGVVWTSTSWPHSAAPFERWHFRTADGCESGWRLTKAEAISALGIDVAPRQTRLWSEDEAMAAPLPTSWQPFTGAPTTPRRSRAHKAEPTPAPQIDWTARAPINADDLTASIAAALARHRR